MILNSLIIKNDKNFLKNKSTSKKNNIIDNCIENGGFIFRQNAIDMIKNLKNNKNGNG